MIFKRIKNKFRQVRIKRQFAQHAEVDSSSLLIAGASCRNEGARQNVQISRHCTIGASFIALFGGVITVGENTYIGHGTSIQAKERITIGSNVIIANNVLVLDNNNHPTSPQMRMDMSRCEDFLKDEKWSWEHAESAPIVIEENVWVGRDARILKGVTIGKGSIVALGAVVTHDVPEYSVVAGNPARVVKVLSRLEGEV